MRYRERGRVLLGPLRRKIFWRAVESIDPGDRVFQALDSLEAHDLIRRESSSWIEGDEQFIFKHVLIRRLVRTLRETEGGHAGGRVSRRPRGVLRTELTG